MVKLVLDPIISSVKMIFFSILVIAIILLCILLCWLITRYSFWKRHKVPFIKPKLNQYWSSFSGDKNLSLQYAEIYEQRSSNFPIIGTFFPFCEPNVLIVDPDLIYNISTTHFHSFQDRGMYHNEKDPLSFTLGTSNFDSWKCFRPKLRSIFKLKQIFPKMVIGGNELVEWLKTTSETDIEIDFRDTFKRFMTDVIGEFLFSSKCNSLEIPNTEMRRMMRKALKSNLGYPRNLLALSFPKLANFFNEKKHCEEGADYFMTFFREIIENRERSDVEHGDVMDSLIELKKDPGLTTNEIVSLAFDLFSNGSADASAALVYCVYELSLSENKIIQDKARQEINMILKKHNGILTYDAMPELIYLEQIIKETLRKHPVPGSATRVATKAFKVPNTDCTISKGMRITFPIYGIHHDKRFYPNPEEFSPERFTQEAISERLPHTYIPFGAGRRSCIGQGFVSLLMKPILALLLQNFEFSTCQRTIIPMEYSPTKNTLKPNSDVWLHVERVRYQSCLSS